MMAVVCYCGMIRYGMAWRLTHFCHCVAHTLGTGLEFIVKALPLTPHTEGFLAPTVSFNESASLCGSPLMESLLRASHSVYPALENETFPGNLQPFLTEGMEIRASFMCCMLMNVPSYVC